MYFAIYVFLTRQIYSERRNFFRFFSQTKKLVKFIDSKFDLKAWSGILHKNTATDGETIVHPLPPLRGRSGSIRVWAMSRDRRTARTRAAPSAAARRGACGEDPPVNPSEV